MFNILGQDNTMNMLERTMDIASSRHSIIASNLANIDTPGYKARDIAFEEELEIALKRAMNNDIRGGASGSFTYTSRQKLRAFEITDVTPRQDGNTVDLDRELGKLAKTTSAFNKAATIYSMKIKLLKKAMES